MNNFKNAQSAFEYYYLLISHIGEKKSNTKFLPNVGFYIENPLDNLIDTKWRKWKKDYAQTEWEWYLSKNRSVSNLKKIASKWDLMHNGDDIVNSNYGYQWSRGDQLEYVVNELKNNPTSRRASISIYDGKEHHLHRLDTPCTIAVTFTIKDDKLNMNVVMRSNDLWFGFCNDQYCFSKLQELVAKRIGIEIGSYYHFAIDLHIYFEHLHRYISPL
jgi:thymidylate synthase